MLTVDFTRAHPQFRVFGTMTCEAATLGELIDHLEAKLPLTIRPGPGDRHFIVLPKGYVGLSPPRANTDIHVTRRENETCPRHDYSFTLEEGDRIIFTVLIC